MRYFLGIRGHLSQHRRHKTYIRRTNTCGCSTDPYEVGQEDDVPDVWLTEAAASLGIKRWKVRSSGREYLNWGGIHRTQKPLTAREMMKLSMKHGIQVVAAVSVDEIRNIEFRLRWNTQVQYNNDASYAYSINNEERIAAIAAALIVASGD